MFTKTRAIGLLMTTEYRLPSFKNRHVEFQEVSFLKKNECSHEKVEKRSASWTSKE